ncbi:DUF2809 domain-containing protein [Mucilaginibacter sp.]|uniref:ribosomal maturation YjgA family protein n=1 Tax=Mucilaginibacter sp. TaxID=1882438 RepID=UPI0035BC5EDC
MLKFNRIYFIGATLLLLTEILIAVYLHDNFIRPYGGDFLVVILIYCLVKSFINYNVNCTAVAVLIFAYLIEWSQWFHLVNIMGLQHSLLARTVMGTDFAWTDMLMYTLGIMLVWVVERIVRCL